MTVVKHPSAEGLIKATEIISLVGHDADQAIVAQIVKSSNRLASYGIATPLRICHFMAQAAHESGGFRLIWERENYTPERIVAVFGKGHSAKVSPTEAAQLAGNGHALFERVYGLGNPKKARELGNREPGDGYRYRGCGLLQLTGRANHQKYCPQGPVSEHLLDAAAAFWADRGCNELADQNDLRAITKRINGGYNGLDERERLFRRAWGIWGDERRAGERSLATVRDVKEAGSTIAQGAGAVGTAGTVATAAGAVKGVTDSLKDTSPPPADLLAAVKEITTDVQATRGVISSAHETLVWLLEHWWIGAVVLGVYLYTKHRALLRSRLKNFRLDKA